MENTHFQRNLATRSKVLKVFICFALSRKKVRKNMSIIKTEDDKTKDGVTKEYSNEVSRNNGRIASDLEIL